MQDIMTRAESVRETIPGKCALKSDEVAQLIGLYQDKGKGIDGLFYAVCTAYDAGFEAGTRYMQGART